MIVSHWLVRDLGMAFLTLTPALSRDAGEGALML
jgi:hypothetical protein